MTVTFRLRVLTAIAGFWAGQALACGEPSHYDVSCLTGGYAYTISGSAVDPLSGSTTQIAEAGRLTADGAGNLTGIDTVAVAGSTIRRTFTGYYAVNPDGSGSLVLDPSWRPQIHAGFFAGQNARILRLIITDPGNTLSGVLEAQQPAATATAGSDFSVASLQGGYDYGMAGSASDDFGNVNPIREVGSLVADGSGTLTGASTVSVNGSVIQRTLTGAYQINPDGSGFATLYPSWGPPIDIDLFLSGNGLAVVFVVTDPGNTLSGSVSAGAPPAWPGVPVLRAAGERMK